MFRDCDDMAKAVPLNDFLKQHHLDDLREPTPLACLALKERLAIPDHQWSYVVKTFDLRTCDSD